MKRFAAAAFGLIWAAALTPVWGGVTFVDLAGAANRGPQDSFDSSFPGAEDSVQKNGLAQFPAGRHIFRGVPFDLLDPAKNQGRSFIALKGRERPDFPEAVTLQGPGGGAKFLYFLQTCHWGGTSDKIAVAQYEVVYDDGQTQVVPLRVGREFTNFWGADDTAQSVLAWWYRYKNSSMGMNLFTWENPRPEKSIRSIVFKSLSKMPVPLLFAVTASDTEIPISSVSPKPEETSVTDMKGWTPLSVPVDDPDSTALDLSALLDAPAGKHGLVSSKGTSLVFADGAPARFWGTRLSPVCLLLPSIQIEVLAGHMASDGFNLVVLDLSGAVSQNPDDSVSKLESAFSQKGIYLCFTGMPVASPSAGTPVPNPWLQDPAIVPAEIFQVAGVQWNPIASDAMTPLTVQNPPQVTQPAESLPAQLVSQRTFDKPYWAEWSEGWPQSYLTEAPLLLSTTAAFQGWAACVGEETRGQDEKGVLVPGIDWDSNPLLEIQWPAAALSYLRGDLKQGKIYVLPEAAAGSDPENTTAPDLLLTALAHQSGRGELKTDILGTVKSKINIFLKSFISDSGQINWQGNIGLYQVDSPRFQAVAGFLSHRQLKSNVWEVESANWFGVISLISLTGQSISTSSHLLLTGVTRMENSGMVYNASQTKVLSLGQAPVLMEPLQAKILITHSRKDPSLKVRALDADRKPLKMAVPFHWVGSHLALSWIPAANYLEIYK
jgi:hypothetical protein